MTLPIFFFSIKCRDWHRNRCSSNTRVANFLNCFVRVFLRWVTRNCVIERVVQMR